MPRPAPRAAHLALAGLLLAVPAWSQEATPAMDHGAMGHAEMEGAMAGMMAAMDRMMAAMPAGSAGSADADFLLLMIPHHQSAIDMARVVIEEGSDPETRALAQAVIDAQGAEIAQMRAMLERLGVEAPPEAAPVP